MTQVVLERLPARSGHFLLESGYHTDVWLTLDTLFQSPRLVAPLVSQLAARLARYSPMVICGPLLGGAFLAQAVATEMGVDFLYTVPSSQPADGGLFEAEYRLPNAQQRSARGQRIVIVDDVISAGSSVRATAAAAERAGAIVIAIGTLLLLGTVARDHFEASGVPMEFLGQRDLNLWSPQNCPLCAAVTPLTSP